MTAGDVADDENCLDIYVVDLDEWATTELHRRVLSPHDKRRAARVRDPTIALRLGARGSATRVAIACRLGIDPRELDIVRRCPRCGSSEHGPPYVDGSTFCSISSSGKWGVVALSNGPVGVDVELVASGLIPLWPACSDSERAALMEQPDGTRGEAFLRLWTAKEAVLKAEGSGLSSDPASVEALALVGFEFAVIQGPAHSWDVRLVSREQAGTSARERMILAIADAASAPLVWRVLEP